ncbi:hypothetical protein BH24ACT22_BH24ACT22_06920 [soil metagenome]
MEISALLAGAVLIGLFARRVGLPFTVVLAFVGFLAGWLGRPLGFESPVEGEEFEEVLVFMFLPVLVFAAALGISTRAFLNNLGAILVLAVPALILSAVFVGLALYFGLGVPFAAALLFGALISATDPVAVVAIFRQLGVPERLLTLVEGESLLNDGLAIVLFNVLLLVALGTGEVTFLGGVLDFFRVFAGGVAIGAGVGLVVALALPWLDRLAAGALSLAAAYGGFVLADYVLGLSGVMATVAAGLVLGGLSPSRASSSVRELWKQLWDALDYVANALLFLLIGLSIDPTLIFENLGVIVLAVLVVCFARAAAVVPLMSALERFAGIPPVGWRNEAVLIWGGLRGGVALALALSLPETLPQRELFVATTGGVVLATLLLNATTIPLLVRRLGLDRPTRAEQFLADLAVVSSAESARKRLTELGFDDKTVMSRLSSIEDNARDGLGRIGLSKDEEALVLTRRGLSVERGVYQHLRDSGLLEPSAARALIHETEDQLEEADLGRMSMNEMDSMRHQRPASDRILHSLSKILPEPGENGRGESDYAAAGARRLGARRARKDLESFRRLPNVDAATVEDACETFSKREREAIETLERLENAEDSKGSTLHNRRAEKLSDLAVFDSLQELSRRGLLTEKVANRALSAFSSGTTEVKRNGENRRHEGH